MRPFGEAQSKAMRAYAQSGQYHTIVESRVRLTRPSRNLLGCMRVRIKHALVCGDSLEFQILGPRPYKLNCNIEI